jgi:hypothetical protein
MCELSEWKAIHCLNIFWKKKFLRGMERKTKHSLSIEFDQQVFGASKISLGRLRVV